MYFYFGDLYGAGVAKMGVCACVRLLCDDDYIYRRCALSDLRLGYIIICNSMDSM